MYDKYCNNINLKISLTSVRICQNLVKINVTFNRNLTDDIFENDLNVKDQINQNGLSTF